MTRYNFFVWSGAERVEFLFNQKYFFGGSEKIDPRFIADKFWTLIGIEGLEWRDVMALFPKAKILYQI